MLGRPAEEAARYLLGQVLVRAVKGRLLAVRIVETEAYLGAKDPAAHAFRGRTPRTAPLFGPPGTIYVYLIYGMYHCLNIAADRRGLAGCILVRAGEPLEGSGLAPDACRGPGRLCRALSIDERETGQHLFSPGSRLYLREDLRPRHLGVSPRVGIRAAADRPLRFFDSQSPAVSRASAKPSRK
jgi:DNA-3-methyladenine glycosylase